MMTDNLGMMWTEFKQCTIVPSRRLPSHRRCSWATSFHSEPNMPCDAGIQHPRW